MPITRFMARILAGFSLACLNAHAAPNLADVFELSLRNDAEIAAAEAQWRASQEAAPQALSALLPQLSARATYRPTTQEVGTAQGDNVSSYDNRSASLSLSQVIYDRRAFLALDQADSRVAGAELDWRLAQQNLILRVTQAYTEVLFAQDAVRLAAAKKQAIAEQREQAEHMHRGGVGTVTDIQEAQARHDLAAAEEINARNVQRIKRQALFKLTGQWLDEVAPLAASLSMNAPEPDDPDAWRAEARNQAIEVRLAEKSLEIARNDLEQARSLNLPVLSMVGDSSWQKDTDSGYSKSNLSYIGVQASLPILTGGRIDSVTRETLARMDQAARLRAKASADSELRSAEAFFMLKDSIERSRALTQAVRSSEIALDAAKIGLDVGYRTSVDVLNAQQQVFAARKDLLQQRYNFIIARLQLKAAIGALSQDDIHSMTPWLTP